jgi:hypothetical protein
MCEMNLRLLVSVTWTSLAIYLALASPAHAYLDPGTGSILLQGLIGAVFGGWVAARLYWSKLKNFVGHRRGRQPEAGSGDGADRPADRR